MNTYKTILAFYQGLAELLLTCKYHEERPNDEFNEKLAADLLALFAKIKDVISIKSYSVALIHDVSDGRDSGFMPYDLASCAFKDLAPHLRDPEACKVIDSFRQILNDKKNQNLFVRVKSARLFGKDKKGPSVVTLVVSSHKNLMALLSGKHTFESGEINEIIVVDKARF
jgi:hypothetical protein